MSNLTIGEAASRVGLSVHAVRYYEDAGMIPTVPRDEAGRREFDPESVAWLEYAACLRAVGMPVRHVADYVRAVTSGASSADAIERIESHLDAMRRRRAEIDDYIGLIEAKLATMRGSTD